jgi:hypothetical protein
LNGLKLQFHCVPCSLEIVSVPLGPLPALEPVPDDPEGEEELQAVASAAASTAAAAVISKRLIGVPSTGCRVGCIPVIAVTFGRCVEFVAFAI